MPRLVEYREAFSEAEQLNRDKAVGLFLGDARLPPYLTLLGIGNFMTKVSHHVLMLLL